MSARIMVDIHPRPYPVVCGAGVLETLPALLARRFPARRAALVTDEYLKSRVAARVANALRKAGWKIAIAALPRGERAKSLIELNKLYGFLLANGIERGTPLIAVGGGTVGDAAGFAAATYYRGIPLVQVPTTLLAQVDSAVGGKTAVNHPSAKNAIGAFHQPVLVAADVGVLETLPDRDFLSGLGEVVKYGLVFDRPFAEYLRRRWPAILRREPAEMIRVVRCCVKIKAGVVAADVRDLAGKRELLNFGHTIGHALESATNYRVFLHGEAVVWGMRAALAISRGRGAFGSAAERALAEDLLGLLGVPPWPRALGASKILPLLKHDKKVRDGRSVFVLLKGIGRPERVFDVSRREIAAAVGGLVR